MGSYLDNANIGNFACLVNRNLRDALDPILDGIRDMGDDLYSLAKVFSFALKEAKS